MIVAALQAINPRKTSGDSSLEARCSSCVGMCAQATRNMAQLASEMKQIKSFLHVSTAYVNCHLGRNVHVEERQYPFTVNGRPVSHADIIAELAALAPEAAERRVSPPILL